MKSPAISLWAALALMLVIGLLSFYAGEWQSRRPGWIESSPKEFVRKLEERHFHGQRMRMQVAAACLRLDANAATGVVRGLARSPVTEDSAEPLSVSDPELAAEIVADALMRLAALDPESAIQLLEGDDSRQAIDLSRLPLGDRDLTNEVLEIAAAQDRGLAQRALAGLVEKSSPWLHWDRAKTFAWFFHSPQEVQEWAKGHGGYGPGSENVRQAAMNTLAQRWPEEALNILPVWAARVPAAERDDFVFDTIIAIETSHPEAAADRVRLLPEGSIRQQALAAMTEAVLWRGERALPLPVPVVGEGNPGPWIDLLEDSSTRDDFLVRYVGLLADQQRADTAAWVDRISDPGLKAKMADEIRVRWQFVALQQQIEALREKWAVPPSRPGSGK